MATPSFFPRPNNAVPFFALHLIANFDFFFYVETLPWALPSDLAAKTHASSALLGLFLPFSISCPYLLQCIRTRLCASIMTLLSTSLRCTQVSLCHVIYRFAEQSSLLDNARF
jgi:hypothetical protein